jgi:hypothetical protein
MRRDGYMVGSWLGYEEIYEGNYRIYVRGWEVTSVNNNEVEINNLKGKI